MHIELMEIVIKIICGEDGVNLGDSNYWQAPLYENWIETEQIVLGFPTSAGEEWGQMNKLDFF